MVQLFVPFQSRADMSLRMLSWELLRVARFQNFKVTTFVASDGFSRGRKTKKTRLEALFATRSCFSYAEDLQLVLSLAAENWHLLDAFVIFRATGICWVFTHHLMAMAIE